MRTDDLIKAISADARSEEMSLDRSWTMALAVAVVLAMLGFFMLIGPRPDIASAVETIRFLFKFVVTVALVATAWGAARALARPGGDRFCSLVWLAVAPVLLVAAMTMEMVLVPSDLWMKRLMGTNSMVCLTFIPLIGLGPLVVFLAALRHGAPANPLLAGAVAGVLAGGVAATFYAAHCTDDSPLFVMTWYSGAIAVLAVLGAVGARLFARW